MVNRLLRPRLRSAAQRHHLAAVRDNGGAGDEAPGVGDQQQERTVEITLLAEPADRDFALERQRLFRLRDIRD